MRAARVLVADAHRAIDGLELRALQTRPRGVALRRSDARLCELGRLGRLEEALNDIESLRAKPGSKRRRQLVLSDELVDASAFE